MCNWKLMGLLQLNTIILVLHFFNFMQDGQFVRQAVVDDPTYPNHVLEVIEIRNLNTKEFPKDLEIEIKNISDKPIYGVTLELVFRQSQEDKRVPRGLSLRYGRLALYDIDQLATATDTPINPNETGILKPAPHMAKAFYGAMEKGELFKKEDTALMTLVFQTINFGDGTGAMFKKNIAKGI